MFRSLILLAAFFAANVLAEVKLVPKLEGSDLTRFSRYLECAGQAEAIVNGDELKKRILAYRFTSTDRSPADVIADMEAGSEILSPLPDSVWNWKVGFYTKWGSRVIGWTNPKIDIVWINKPVWDKMDCPAIMANIVHEYLHKIRYGHKSAKDHSSVPYAVGYMVEAIARDPALKLPEPEIKPLPEVSKNPRKSWLSRLRSWIGI
jgi:hypothetical protein